MEIKRENTPPREKKAPTAFPKYPLESETGAKNRRVCTTQDQTYWSGGQKSRV